MSSTGRRLTEPVDALELGTGRRLTLVSDGDGAAVVPEVFEQQAWRRAHPGDGVAEALLHLLAGGPITLGRFTVRSWVQRDATGERGVGVDQTNESVIVGDAAVVKWASRLIDGPHPAPRRISLLREAGFEGMPTPWGLVTWCPQGGDETLVASVDEYLPGAVDGWTWAVDVITSCALQHRVEPITAAATDVGTLVAELHAALAGTETLASQQDAVRWRTAAVRTLESVCALEDSPSVLIARSHRAELAAVLDGLGALAGSPVIEGHGDLHVGQVLRSNGRLVVTDFDGNPVLSATERMRPIPAALDVAGLAQSLSHAAIVARKYTDLDADALAEVDAAGRAAFEDAYVRRLTSLRHRGLYEASQLRAFRVQQVLREIIYAAKHLPRWMYVPDAALPALLDAGTPS